MAEREHGPSNARRLRSIAAHAAGHTFPARLDFDAVQFIKHYYGHLPPSDLAGDAGELATEALDHLLWGRTRKAGTAKIRVFNPTPDRDGFASPHTHVEIVNDDMPFLVDSVSHALSQLGHGIALTIHPRFEVQRNGRGTLKRVYREASVEKANTESFIHIELTRVTDTRVLGTIKADLDATLREVRAAAEDQAAMRQRLANAAAEISDYMGPPEALLGESRAFLEWLSDEHFALFGYHEFTLLRGRHAYQLLPVSGTGLGILGQAFRPSKPFQLTGAARDEARSVRPLVITKTQRRSRIHRPVPLDYISVKVFDTHGRPYLERRFLGLFTTTAGDELPRHIPLLRHKTRQLLEHSGAEPSSHHGRTLQHIIDSLPRDDLFQASLETLARITTGILGLQERRRLRLFSRQDAFGRFWSCLVYLPRDQYNPTTRDRIEKRLLSGLDGRSVESDIEMSDSVLARMRVIVWTDTAARPAPGRFNQLELELAEAAQSWKDRLRETLLVHCEEDQALQRFHRFAGSFTAAYQEELSPQRCIEDIEQIEALVDNDTPRVMQLVPDSPENPRQLRFTVYSRAEAIPLHCALPLLENMGLQVLGERVYPLQIGGARIAVQDFALRAPSDMAVNTLTLAAPFCACFAHALDGDIDNDGFNSLVTTAGLGWQDVVLIRAYHRYLRQTSLHFTQRYIQTVLGQHPRLCRALIGRFRALFDPSLNSRQRGQQAAKHERVLHHALNETVSLDEDRILRAFVNAVEATLRTNSFQFEGDRPKECLALKLDPSRLPNMPAPCPQFEIFVYARRFEATHLRCGPVARGGIRWSDRPEDYRTEVLGLMKTQQIKNAIIVPAGAKGGFVCKQLPTNDPEGVRLEVATCYQAFMRSLLDLTDNIIDGRTVPPLNVVARDGDDAYLVVAADKGTGSFSDLANAISRDYNYWLRDAFASGGSHGYDHKAMGITARGAWVSVERHFRELGIDPLTKSFSAIGIGDMSGDVFGNGMLHSEHIRLVAAFDHRHIFIDPTPDPKTSFAERGRLFTLPRSNWNDYDRSALSSGGGVYSRQSKSIQLSTQARELLGLDSARITPPALIKAILKAPVDLLWNGGIGTYVKASTESHTAAGDPTNDDVRVNGQDLCCQVVGEGGNLGFTQAARIEYAHHGGRINADFIDNSAGVDTSDREVNLKILLRMGLDAGVFRSSRRNALLARLKASMAAHVLADNYGQTQALSVVHSQSIERIGEQADLITLLEHRGELDRSLDHLPTNEIINTRHRNGLGLTRPELCVVLSHSKNALARALLETDIPDDPFCAKELARYFPPGLPESVMAFTPSHPLRREIVAMMIAGSLVNRMGPYFPFRACEETGAEIGQVTRAYVIVRELFGIRRLWRDVEALDRQAPAPMQYKLLFRIGRAVRHAVYWFLQHYSTRLDIESMRGEFQPGIDEILPLLSKLTLRNDEPHVDSDGIEANAVPKRIVHHVTALDSMTQILDIAQLAKEHAADAAAVARVHFSVGQSLQLTVLRQHIDRLAVEGHWRAMARATLRETLGREHRAVAAGILQRHPKADSESALAAWHTEFAQPIQRLNRVLEDIQAAGPIDFETLSVAVKEVARLT